MKLFHEMSPEVAETWKKTDNPILLHYTGSMFGMGCDARDQTAITKINDLKKRPPESGYIVLVADYHKLTEFNAEMNSRLAGLVKQYSPGALTIVLPCSHPDLQHLLFKDKIAFRIPQAPLIREFLKSLDIPLISTSINIAGENPQINYMNILTDFKSWFELAIIPEDELIAEGEPSTVITLENDKLVCLRDGQLDFKELEEDFYHPLISFVCTGNICRSPLAEYYFRQQVTKQGLGWRSASAGFLGNGIPISENSRIVLERDGIDSADHRSEKLNYEIIRRSRLVITMTRNHKQSLINTGWKSDHVFTLAEFAGKSGDIEDPYQESLEVYQATYKQIKYYIDLLINKLKSEQK